MPLSILHILTSFHPQSAAGGPVYNVHAYSQGLLQRDHRVAVCCSDYLDLKRKVPINTWNHGVSKPIPWDGIEVTYFKSLHLGYGGYGAIASLPLIPYLHREIKNFANGWILLIIFIELKEFYYLPYDRVCKHEFVFSGSKIKDKYGEYLRIHTCNIL